MTHPPAPDGRRTARRGSVLGALALSVALSLSLAGCFNVLHLIAGGEQSTPTGEEVPSELAPYYGQVLDWTPCENGAQCATAIAPLDWQNPSSETDIELALVRHKARGGDPQGSLFFNPGGPGGSGVDFVKQAPESVVSADVRAEFDLIGWDPRGVGASSSVTCYTDPAQFDEFLFGVPDADPGSDAWREEVERSAVDFVDACERNTGELLGFIDTVSTVRDLDMLRAVVGDPKLNYFGMSYGTRVGAQYADLFPENVGRLVLDGVANPASSMFEVVVDQTIGFDRALRAYLEACPADAACPFTGDADRDIRTIDALYDELDANPIRHSDGRLLDSGALDTAVNAALYEESYWQYLTIAFNEVAQGEAATAFALADNYVGRVDGEYPTRFFESFIAITCVDFPTEADEQVLQQQTDRLLEISPLVNDVVMPDPVCGNWPYPPRGGPTTVEAEGSDPILLVGTTGDPATPYESAVEVAEQLDNAVLLTYEGDDHIAYDEGDACVVGIVDSYFISGELPADGAPRCG